MKYTFPQEFDIARAATLGDLIESAYRQKDALDKPGTTWTPPAGYQILGELQASELVKSAADLKDHVSTFQDVLKRPSLKGIADMARGLQPTQLVPFGFVAARGGELFVIIRGTRTHFEWLNDFTALP